MITEMSYWRNILTLLFRDFRPIPQSDIEDCPPFASRDWCDLPFGRSEKTIADELLDMLLSLPRFMLRVGDTCSRSAGSATGSWKDEEEPQLVKLLSELRCSERQYMQERSTGRKPISPDSPLPTTFSTSSSASSDLWEGGGGDFCTVSPCSMYDSANIIVLYLISSGRPGSLEQYLVDEQFNRLSFCSSCC